jgi:hypothetical protein
MATISNVGFILNKKKNGKKIKVSLVGTGFSAGPNPPATKVVIRLPADPLSRSGRGGKDTSSG